VIAGGDGKGQDFAPLQQEFRDKVTHALLIGRDARAIRRGAGRCLPDSLPADLPAAVAGRGALARSGDTVLLSPACASLDMFRDYAHRGQVFAQSVAELPA
jgi:UDP-N-acetylmuramoylalanine--D-glutamate ligase